MSKTKRRLIPTKLKLIPAAMISVIILAVMSLLGLLNFTTPSVSESSSDQTKEPAEQTAADANTTTTEGALVAASELIGGSFSSDSAAVDPTEVPDPTESLVPLELVDVLIDGDTYWVGVGRREEEVVREARTVGEIVRASQQTEGDSSGIKTRVTRTFEATAQAERALVSALAEAGLSEDEIDQRRTLVDRPAAISE